MSSAFILSRTLAGWPGVEGFAATGTGSARPLVSHTPTCPGLRWGHRPLSLGLQANSPLGSVVSSLTSRLWSEPCWPSLSIRKYPGILGKRFGMGLSLEKYATSQSSKGREGIFSKPQKVKRSTYTLFPG